MPERFRTPVLAAAFTGLHWGEVVGLRRCDVNLGTGTCTSAVDAPGSAAAGHAWHAAVAAFAPTELRGSAFGLLATVQAVGNVAASAIAGLLYTLATPTIAFGYLAAWMLAALLLLLAPARTASQAQRECS